MSFNDKLYERMDFYRGAYKDTSAELLRMEEELGRSKTLFETTSMNFFEDSVKKELSRDDAKDLEKQYLVQLDDIEYKCDEKLKALQSEINQKKNDDSYKEYLRIVLDDGIKTVIEMETDEVFSYLILQHFHNDSFKNEPFIEFFGLKYQPRYWKFAAIANKKAISLGFSNYQEMFKLWNDLRINYKSLAGDRMVSEITQESMKLEEEIKALEEQIIEMPQQFRKDIIVRLVEVVLAHTSDYLEVHGMADLVPYKEKYSTQKQTTEGLIKRANSIMENISQVENIISAFESEGIQQEEKSYERFFNNNNPETPIFELISEENWKELQEAFAAKKITLKSREDYSVVKTKISKNTKTALLEKYGVKEGEIFIDETLR